MRRCSFFSEYPNNLRAINALLPSIGLQSCRLTGSSSAGVGGACSSGCCGHALWLCSLPAVLGHQCYQQL
jgi:hypothetical protein